MDRSEKQKRLETWMAQLERMSHASTDEPPLLRTETLRSWLEMRPPQRRVLLVDVREPEERRVSILRTAVTPLEAERQIQQQVKKRWEAEHAVLVAYCTAGVRSGAYARAWLARHPEWRGRVYNAEGILGATYIAPELIVDAESGESVRRVHVYTAAWDWAADGFDTERYSPWQVTARQARDVWSRWRGKG
ncbi:hypothetical protein CDCA_CDCA06G1894 [Cyanidium caldarium]|uniref:Rhodanese domain-containing protein n=1 Tax=Cyanidium caldarium TaxID=2771 RepID=A0AAV9IUE8_CYACA|nr:hypothetical protein CDCA_CDCA06G1894 [Cyanidium caldarium]